MSRCATQMCITAVNMQYLTPNSTLAPLNQLTKTCSMEIILCYFLSLISKETGIDQIIISSELDNSKFVPYQFQRRIAFKLHTLD